MKPTIHAYSKADSVAGQGVGSAYLEQTALIQSELADEFQIVPRAQLFGSFGDINHFHSINPEFFAGIPFARRRGAAVGHVHFIPETVEESISLPRPARAVFYRYLLRFYRSMDHLVTVNPWFTAKLAEDYGFSPDRFTFIPNFVSDKLFHPIGDSSHGSYRSAPGSERIGEPQQLAALRERLSLGADERVVMCAGQLQIRKGFFDFLATARAMPDVRFLWAGDFSFGRITAGHGEIKEAMAALPANVELVGLIPRQEMNLWFNLADAFFLPSFEELFPMTILEAMAAHTPIVVRDLVYYEGVLNDYAERITTPKGEVEPFVQALRRVIEPGAARDTALAAAQRGAEFYNRSSVARQWREFYRSVL